MTANCEMSQNLGNSLWYFQSSLMCVACIFSHIYKYTFMSIKTFISYCFRMKLKIQSPSMWVWSSFLLLPSFPSSLLFLPVFFLSFFPSWRNLLSAMPSSGIWEGWWECRQSLYGEYSLPLFTLYRIPAIFDRIWLPKAHRKRYPEIKCAKRLTF